MEPIRPYEIFYKTFQPVNRQIFDEITQRMLLVLKCFKRNCWSVHETCELTGKIIVKRISITDRSQGAVNTPVIQFQTVYSSERDTVKCEMETKNVSGVPDGKLEVFYIANTDEFIYARDPKVSDYMNIIFAPSVVDILYKDITVIVTTLRMHHYSYEHTKEVQKRKMEHRETEDDKCDAAWRQELLHLSETLRQMNTEHTGVRYETILFDRGKYIPPTLFAYVVHLPYNTLHGTIVIAVNLDDDTALEFRYHENSSRLLSNNETTVMSITHAGVVCSGYDEAYQKLCADVGKDHGDKIVGMVQETTGDPIKQKEKIMKEECTMSERTHTIELRNVVIKKGVLPEGCDERHYIALKIFSPVANVHNRIFKMYEDCPMEKLTKERYAPSRDGNTTTVVVFVSDADKIDMKKVWEYYSTITLTLESFLIPGNSLINAVVKHIKVPSIGEWDGLPKKQYDEEKCEAVDEDDEADCVAKSVDDKTTIVRLKGVRIVSVSSISEWRYKIEIGHIGYSEIEALKKMYKDHPIKHRTDDRVPQSYWFDGLCGISMGFFNGGETPESCRRAIKNASSEIFYDIEIALYDTLVNPIIKSISMSYWKPIPSPSVISHDPLDRKYRVDIVWESDNDTSVDAIETRNAFDKRLRDIDDVPTVDSRITTRHEFTLRDVAINVLPHSQATNPVFIEFAPISELEKAAILDMYSNTPLDGEEAKRRRVVPHFWQIRGTNTFRVRLYVFFSSSSMLHRLEAARPYERFDVKLLLAKGQINITVESLTFKKMLRGSVGLFESPTETESIIHTTANPGETIWIDSLGCKNETKNSGGTTMRGTSVSIEKLFFNGSTTIVMWTDGTKTVVQPIEGEKFDPEIGIAMAIARKLFGSRHQFDKFVDEKVSDLAIRDAKAFTDKELATLIVENSATIAAAKKRHAADKEAYNAAKAAGEKKLPVLSGLKSDRRYRYAKIMVDAFTAEQEERKRKKAARAASTKKDAKKPTTAKKPSTRKKKSDE